LEKENKRKMRNGNNEIKHNSYIKEEQIFDEAPIAFVGRKNN